MSIDNKSITSIHNERVKRLLSLLLKSSVRRAEGLYVVEGMRELKHCIHAGYEVNAIFYCPEILNFDEEISDYIKTLPSFPLSEKVYEKVAYRGSTEGILAEVKCKYLALSELSLSDNPLIVVLEGVEKPGNLGAILRTADAAGVDAVIVCDAPTDLYNPNLIRSSLGGLFSVPCISCTTTECIDFLKSKKIQIISAQLQDSVPYYDTNMRVPTALVLGSEATGLTDEWRKVADAHVKIPMLGQLDSLNVSTSAAILVYEVVRQRRVQ